MQEMAMTDLARCKPQWNHMFFLDRAGGRRPRAFGGAAPLFDNCRRYPSVPIRFPTFGARPGMCFPHKVSTSPPPSDLHLLTKHTVHASSAALHPSCSFNCIVVKSTSVAIPAPVQTSTHRATVLVQHGTARSQRSVLQYPPNCLQRLRSQGQV